jgi:hypothetical protein
MANDGMLEELIASRGLYTDTIVRFEIGWNNDERVYTIPIRGLGNELWNVRKYDPHPRDTRRKIWSVRGMRSTELFPIQQLVDADRVVVIETEWDTLVTIQNGFPCVTRTGAADVWVANWAEHFEGKVVYLCHDADTKGQRANGKVAKMLRHLADVRICSLPYPITEKHGQDVGDFWMEHDRADFEQMLSEARPYQESKSKDPEVITVLESFDAQKVGEPVKLQVTIKGKKEPGYTVPHKARLTCSQDKGPVCKICPLNAAKGEATYDVAPNNPIILGMIDATSGQVNEAIQKDYGIPIKCPKLEINVSEYQAVEILFARPSIDHSDGTKAQDYKNIKITSASRHDTMANNTVIVTGARHPNPRDQRNEFLAWDVQRQETSVDRFELTPETITMMRRFRPKKGQRPLRKLGEISRDLAEHVTHIIGRPEMHALMDLTFHSVLSFKFGGQIVHRGWLESLVAGDTRTGKSEAAQQLVRHYGAGEIVGGETASLAGLVGGLQQIGGKDWTITWGAIPINDRRLVVIDEVSGLHTEDIAKMSDVRASGMARLTKIQQEVTFARTRLLWLGNPRFGTVAHYTHGIDLLPSLIGNPEDIARFDLAMAVSILDVPSEEINRPRKIGKLHYTSEACHTLLMWAWTRQPDQITWAKGAEDEVFRQANQLGSRYVEDPPLIQAANVRIKIARTAIALAARTFSTDRSYEKILVTKEHVVDAVAFIDRLYGMETFGYAERSRELLDDLERARSNRTKITRYLRERKGLARFLRSTGRFQRRDLEEIMNVDRDTASSVINTLWEARMVRKDKQDVRVEPTLNEILRKTRS